VSFVIATQVKVVSGNYQTTGARLTLSDVIHNARVMRRITLVAVTYAQLRVVILLFQSQGQSVTVLAASLWQDRPRGTLFQYRYAAAIFHPRFVVI